MQSNAPYGSVLRTQLNHLANLAKWLSVRLRTKWFWVRVQLQSLKLICCLTWTKVAKKFFDKVQGPSQFKNVKKDSGDLKNQKLVLSKKYLFLKRLEKTYLTQEVPDLFSATN